MSHRYSRQRRDRALTVNHLVGANVRKIRLGLGLTQAEVSKLVADAHESYLRSVENGHKQMSLVRLVEIADALGVRPADLLEGV